MQADKKMGMGCLAFTIIFFLVTGTAAAHKVTVFAWVEDDTVHTESKFSGGRHAKNSEIVVFGTEENELVRGLTDDQGAFSFKIPQKTSLRVVLKAGMGHQAEWMIPAEEVGGDALAEQSTELTPAAASESLPAVKSPDPPTLTEALPQISKADIRMAVEEALDKKLTPLMKMLRASQEQKPSLTDIIGGIGYIIGLIGIAAYFNSKRKTD